MEIDAIVEACLEKVREQSVVSKGEDQNHILHRYRCDLEPYIYNYLTMKYGPALEEHWKQHQFPKQSKYAWVIVERRCHPNWWFLLRNLAWSAPHFSLYLFCSDENIEFLKRLLGPKQSSVHLIPWSKGFASREDAIREYNRTMKSEEFYNTIHADYAIVAQLDSYLRYRIPYSILFTDYYGAPWSWKPDMPGGGGLSVRRIESMRYLCQNGVNREDMQEDDWISENTKKLGLQYPSFEIRRRIFSENFPVESPIGVHQFWTFLHSFEIHDPKRFKEHLQRYLTIHMD